MGVHWVNYDLNKSGQDYDALITYLKSHESWARPVASSFFVKTALSVSALRDGILEHIDANDAVIVVEVTGASWASRGIPKTVSDWLYSQL